MTASVNVDLSERRRETRRPYSGPVTLAFDDPLPRQLKGELMDVSQSGFRCRHTFSGLKTGQQVRFRHPLAQGEARVIWNRILDGGVESGFFVL